MKWLGESTDGERLAEFAGRLCYMSQKNPASRRDARVPGEHQEAGTRERAGARELLAAPRGSEPVAHPRAGAPSCRIRLLSALAAVRGRVGGELRRPPAIIGDEALESALARADREAAQKSYVALVEQLMQRYAWVGDKVHRRKMAREAARGVLPNSTETKIVVTGNARAWRTMLELRSSEGAELEIRRCAVAMLRLFCRGRRPDFSPTSRFIRPRIAARRRGSATTKSEKSSTPGRKIRLRKGGRPLRF